MKRIILTGAPSSGKSSALKHLAGLALPGLAFVPESARVLLAGGYPAPAHGDLKQIHAFQQAILTLQTKLEADCDARAGQIDFLILDRGRPDGACFWPAGADDFFRSFALDAKQEMGRFDHVLFLEMPPAAQFGQKDAERFHDHAQSLEVERRLEALWSRHPGFERIPAQPSLAEKVALVERRVRALTARP